MATSGWTGGPPTPYPVVALLVALVVLGVSAVAGGIGLLVDTSGEVLGLPVSLLAGSPFEDYLIPGLVLLSVLGILPLVVGYALLRRRPLAWPGVVAVGLAVPIWFAVQARVIGWGNPIQWAYLAIGVAILLLAFLPSVRRFSRVSQLAERLRSSGE